MRAVSMRVARQMRAQDFEGAARVESRNAPRLVTAAHPCYSRACARAPAGARAYVLRLLEVGDGHVRSTRAEEVARPDPREYAATHRDDPHRGHHTTQERGNGAAAGGPHAVVLTVLDNRVLEHHVVAGQHIHAAGIDVAGSAVRENEGVFD